jgi:hypothetical protein
MRTEEIHTDPSAIGFASVPELENRPRSDFENSVMSELGPKVLDRTNRLDPNGNILGFVVAAIVLSLLFAILIGRRVIGRRALVAVQPPPPPPES